MWNLTFIYHLSPSLEIDVIMFFFKGSVRNAIGGFDYFVHIAEFTFCWTDLKINMF